MTTMNPSTQRSAHLAEDTRVLARRIGFHAFCRRHYVHLVGDADRLLRDEREAAAVVQGVFDAILDGQIHVPTIDTYRRLKESVLGVAVRRIEARRALRSTRPEPDPEARP